ncbi:porin [Noviherbaspirillum autotrophicum]|uniref:Porin domain-containing protein n=1 Tax=Noviherbaspirillum autotrophicum TaxID=709839 RepID=A0A0C2BSX8_9BURK|nr:porin [Noviherbaspirillum autotrophicum]KIF81166.1 hypothetical protein TSA66_10670 [Noviherbaspirillum autotrophicum]
MKKSLLALAVLGAFAGAASAQTNVTIYGVVDAGIAFDNGSKDAGKIWALQSGQQSGSRLGFKGTEDLGGGLSAVFTLENGFSVDDGVQGQGALFGRQAWVGLQGQFGSVKLGRQYTSIYNALNVIDPFGINLAGNAQKIFGNGQYATDRLQRVNNTISYTSNNYSGFTGGVNYGFGEVAGSNTTGRDVGVALSYVNGPINVQYAYNKSTANPTATGTNAGTVTDLTANFIGATYDFGVAKAHVAFADNKSDTVGTSTKDRNWLLGVSAPVGAAGTVMASWIRDDVKDVAGAKTNLYAIGYSHALSKRTNLYTSFGYTKNDTAASLSEYGSTGTQTAGESDRLFNVGVRHTF